MSPLNAPCAEQKEEDTTTTTTTTTILIIKEMAPLSAVPPIIPFRVQSAKKPDAFPPTGPSSRMIVDAVEKTVPPAPTLKRLLVKDKKIYWPPLVAPVMEDDLTMVMAAKDEEVSWEEWVVVLAAAAVVMDQAVVVVVEWVVETEMVEWAVEWTAILGQHISVAVVEWGVVEEAQPLSAEKSTIPLREIKNESQFPFSLPNPWTEMSVDVATESAPMKSPAKPLNVPKKSRFLALATNSSPVLFPSARGVMVLIINKKTMQKKKKVSLSAAAGPIH
mmetsp:Transcript_34185/g.82869  ORF Transcript_34185/g.82869 Transcript_34185/m.82869 type:complete len:276 (+) Transcript_34185:255-1082(+)